jgi:hypothetical protein
MIAFIFSVQYTANRFTQDLLTRHGIEYVHAHPVKSRLLFIRGWLRKCHDNNWPIVVPLRIVQEVTQSWLRRDKNLDEMCDQWRMLNDELDGYEICPLPVDSAFIRENHLKYLSERCGVEITTDWANYGGIQGERVPWPDGCIELVGELLLEMPALVEVYMPGILTQKENVPHGTCH